MQRAACVVEEAVGAGVHALEHVWQGRTGHGLTASFFPVATLQARQPKILPEGDAGKGFIGVRQAYAVRVQWWMLHMWSKWQKTASKTNLLGEE